MSFLDSEYFYNKKACIREWVEYFNDPSNGVKEHANTLLQDLKMLHISPTKEEFTMQMRDLRKSPIWNKDVDLAFRQAWFSLVKVCELCLIKVLPKKSHTEGYASREKLV